MGTNEVENVTYDATRWNVQHASNKLMQKKKINVYFLIY